MRYYQHTHTHMSRGDEPSSSRTSVNERLARARAEDLRRQRNVQSKLHIDAVATSSRLPAPSPWPSATPSSSSARAGLLFLSSTRLAHTEREETLRNRQLNRQVAGPIPPASWQNEFERLAIRRGTASHLSSPQAQQSHATQSIRAAKLLRYQTCAVFRHFTHALEANASPSLRDMTLCIIADALNQPYTPATGKTRSLRPPWESERQRTREVLEYLPSHMRDRLMALCGRLAQTEYPLSDGTAQALIDLHGRRAIDHQTPNGDWQDESSLDNSSHVPTLLDLSFSRPGAHIWKMWTTLDTAPSLRALSLAGWTADPALDSSIVLTALARLRNLETLSLAGSTLAPDTDARSTILLRKLGRTLVKLQLLDVSCCHWISADAICGVSWSAAFPALRRLVLHGCEAFRDPEMEPGLFEEDTRPSDNYVAPWHARHCLVHTRSEGIPTAPDRVPPTEDNYDASGGGNARVSGTSFRTFTSGALLTPTVSNISTTSDDAEPVLTTLVRCPRSAAQIPLWLWQRVRVLDALRGRSQTFSPSHRQWVDVWF